MTDTYGILKSAHQIPDLDNKIALLSGMEHTFARLCDTFPNNERFRTQRDAISAAKAVLRDLTDHPDELEDRLPKIRRIFEDADMGPAVDLHQWGLA